MFVVELLSRVLPLQLGDSFLSSVGTEVKIQRTTLLAGSLLVRLLNPLVSYPTRWSLSFVLGPLCIDHQHISYIQGTKKYSAVMYYQPTCWCQAGTLSALCCSQSPFLICTLMCALRANAEILLNWSLLQSVGIKDLTTVLKQIVGCAYICLQLNNIDRGYWSQGVF